MLGSCSTCHTISFSRGFGSRSGDFEARSTAHRQANELFKLAARAAAEKAAVADAKNDDEGGEDVEDDAAAVDESLGIDVD